MGDAPQLDTPRLRSDMGSLGTANRCIPAPRYLDRYLAVNYFKLPFAEFHLLSFLLFILPCIIPNNTPDVFPHLSPGPGGTVLGLWMCARERESKLFSFISFPFRIIAPRAAS